MHLTSARSTSWLNRSVIVSDASAAVQVAYKQSGIVVVVPEHAPQGADDCD